MSGLSTSRAPCCTSLKPGGSLPHTWIGYNTLLEIKGWRPCLAKFPSIVSVPQSMKRIMTKGVFTQTMLTIAVLTFEC